MAIHSRNTRRTIQDGITNLTDFKAPATLTGEMSDYVGFTGYLPTDEQDILRAHAATGPVYIVRSYATPIAWHTAEHGWYVSKEKHSVTTSGHQSAVRSAIDGSLVPSWW